MCARGEGRRRASMHNWAFNQGSVMLLPEFDKRNVYRGIFVYLQVQHSLKENGMVKNYTRNEILFHFFNEI